MRNALKGHPATRRGILLAVACLLAAASWATAQDSAPPVKVGGAIGVSWAYGSYGDDDNLYAGVGDLGANGNDTWNWRINFRYYF